MARTITTAAVWSLALAAFAAGAGSSIGVQAIGPEQAAPPKLATIKSIRRSVLPDAVRVTIELDAEVPFRNERIENPSRLFVDFAGARPVATLVDQTLRFDGDSDVVRQVRLGRHPNNTTRVVLEAAGVTSYSVYALYNPYRLVIDCVRAAAPAVAAVALVTEPLATTSLFVPTPPGALHPRAAFEAISIPEPAHASPAPDAAAPPPAPTSPPTSGNTGGYSIARQLGLRVSRIVIDPGHGGHDPGAQGRSVDEAELVLDVALRLEKLLQQLPNTEVILTRRTDEFITLQERTAIANREGADLFLSIHANASTNPSARGIETYYLNFASNLSAAAVAARENAASGQAMGALPDFVRAIALNNKLDESRELATNVQQAMVERLRGSNKTLKDLGVKQAPFVVLIGAAMPSVLAEISFVTNAQESKLLKGSPYRQRIAEALRNAVKRYQSSLKGAMTVAHQ